MKDGAPDRPDKIDSARFDAEATELREALLNAQFDLAESGRQTVLLLLNGADGAGKGAVLNRLHEWLDPRTLQTLAFDIGDPGPDRHPFAWRYWNEMPPNGRIGVVLGSWYHRILLERAVGESGRKVFLEQIAGINRDEEMLESGNVTLIKVWLRIDPGQIGHHAGGPRDAPGGARNPLLREWTEINTKRERKALVRAAEELLVATTDCRSPWHVVEVGDPHARDLAVGRLLLQALVAAGKQRPRAKGKPQTRPRRITKGPSVLPALQLDRNIDGDSYETALAEGRARIFELTQSRAFRRHRSLVVVFEGNDAAGKGGAIRRLRGAINPLTSRVHSIAAPNDEERARPYLWRFWRRIPERGHVSVFDRSWYGRVLVERVEGFAAADDWHRAYEEINGFERELAIAGAIVVKFWLAIDEAEQLARFEARKETPYKRFKITDEDWRNREKWPLYAAAVEDMVALTSTASAPWTLVESNSKRFARVKIIETLAERLEQELT